MRSAASMMAMLATAYHSHRAPAPLALKTCWTGDILYWTLKA